MVNSTAINAAALNAAPAPPPAAEEPATGGLTTTVTTYRRRGTINAFTLNSALVGGGRLSQTTTTVEEPATTVTTYRRRGTINAFTLNSAVVGGGRLSQTTTTVEEPATTVTVYRRRGTVNAFTLNSTVVGGGRLSQVTQESTGGGTAPQNYSDTLEALALWVDEIEGAQTTYFTEVALGSVELEDAQTMTMEALGYALHELETLAATSSTVDSLSLGSAEIAATRGVTDTLERLAAGVAEVMGSRGQYESFERGFTGTDEMVLESRGYNETLEVLGLAFGEITRAGNTSFDTLDELALAVAEVTGVRRVFEPTLETAGTSSDEVVSGIMRASQRVVETGVGYEELTATFLHVIRDTVEALGAATDEMVSGTLHANVVFEILAYGTTHLSPTPKGEAWVFNTRTLAMSRYEGTEASQMVAGPEGALAATNQGIATQDDDRSRRARVKWGTSDFGSQQLKSLRHVYFTAAGDKPLKINTLHGYGDALSSTLYERMLNDTRVPTVYRMNMDRGVRVPLWGFELIADADTNATVIDQRVIMMIDRRRV